VADFFLETTWPLAALFLGIVLAVGAIILTYAQVRANVPVFTLAVIALLVGLVGLLLQSLREPTRGNVDKGDEPSALQVYRITRFAIDRPFLHKLAQVAEVLKTRVHTQHWEADWETFERHHAQAERFLAKGELTPACREYCRAFRPLVEVVHRQRDQEESFQPVWERSEK
jgi:hypothetical protein